MKKSAAVPQLRVRRPHAQTGLSIPSAIRLKRFTAGITLQDAARAASMSLSRASVTERSSSPDPRDVAALDRAVTALAAVRS
jgi:hypothetical protein